MRRLLDTRDFLYGRNDRHESRCSSTSAENYSQDPRNRAGTQRGQVLETTERLRTGSPDCGAVCSRTRPGGARAERHKVGRTHCGFPHHGAPASRHMRQPAGAGSWTRFPTCCNSSGSRPFFLCFVKKNVIRIPGTDFALFQQVKPEPIEQPGVQAVRTLKTECPICSSFSGEQS